MYGQSRHTQRPARAWIDLGMASTPLEGELPVETCAKAFAGAMHGELYGQSRRHTQRPARALIDLGFAPTALEGELQVGACAKASAGAMHGGPAS